MHSIDGRSGREAGLSFWQFLVMLVVIGFVALMLIKTVPLYLNEMKVNAAVDDVAQNGRLGHDASVYSIRRALQDHWDIDDIDTLTPADVGVSRDTGDGRTLSWDYEARTNLFMNVYLVIHFTGSKAMRD
ncbi:MAG TPA: DUF4845 domain-containing protein [Nevskiaceae bacterium]